LVLYVDILLENAIYSPASTECVRHCVRLTTVNSYNVNISEYITREWLPKVGRMGVRLVNIKHIFGTDVFQCIFGMHSDWFVKQSFQRHLL